MCKIKECKKDSIAKGFCMTHYQRMRRNGTVELINKPVEGICSSCKVEDVYIKGLCRKCYYYSSNVRVVREAYFSSSEVKKKMRLAFNKWQKNNTEKVKVRDANRRALGEVPKEFKLSDRCDICGKVGEKMTLEHWTPVCQGGTNDIENLGTLCKSCNASKGGKNLLEFLIYLERV